MAVSILSRDAALTLVDLGLGPPEDSISNRETVKSSIKNALLDPDGLDSDKSRSVGGLEAT